MKIGIGIGIPPYPAQRGGFLPAQLSGLALWLSADSGVEEASGNPAEDTDTAQFWRDRSGNARDVSQGTAANRPIYHTSGGSNGQPYLEFDGTNDSLVATFTLNQPEHLFWIALPSRAQAAGGQTWIDGNATNAMRVFCAGAVDAISAYAGVQRTTVGPSIRSWQRGEVKYNGASSELIVNGQTDTGDIGANNAGGIKLGCLGSGVANFSDCNIAEIILYDRILSAGEVAQVRAYLAGKYGSL